MFDRCSSQEAREKPSAGKLVELSVCFDNYVSCLSLICLIIISCLGSVHIEGWVNKKSKKKRNERLRMHERRRRHTASKRKTSLGTLYT